MFNWPASHAPLWDIGGVGEGLLHLFTWLYTGISSFSVISFSIHSCYLSFLSVYPLSPFSNLAAYPFSVYIIFLCMSILAVFISLCLSVLYKYLLSLYILYLCLSIIYVYNFSLSIHSHCKSVLSVSLFSLLNLPPRCSSTFVWRGSSEANSLEIYK